MSVEDIRKRIDEIDTVLHDLIMERAALVAPLAGLKAAQGGSRDFLRPGRETQIMRRLLARHEGVLPPAVIYKIWRELIVANLHLQGPLSIHLAGDLEIWDQARIHFGVETPIRRLDSAGEVLAEVTGTRGAVGVLPVPQSGGHCDAWWTGLPDWKDEGPVVVARLPYLKGAQERDPEKWATGFPEKPSANSAGPNSYVLANVTPDASGDDIGLVVLNGDLTGESASGVLADFGRRVTLIACHGDGDTDMACLCEVEGFAPDAALSSLSGQSGIRSANLIGLFAGGL